MNSSENPSSILFQNLDNTVFLIDLPTSIALGQDLSQAQQPPSFQRLPAREINNKKSLLSSLPLETPYPSSTEPKSDTARAKVLQRIPTAERAYHTGLIEPLVREGLNEIRNGYGDDRDWCLARYIPDYNSDDAAYPSKKRVTNTKTTSGEYKIPIEGSSTGISPSKRTQKDDFLFAEPPIVLSPNCVNGFESISELRNHAIQNTSFEPTTLKVGPESHCTFYVPPLSAFVMCTLPTSQTSEKVSEPIPGLRNQKFNLILLDPPWPNRSVRRGRHYHTKPYFDIDTLTHLIGNILQAHLYNHSTEKRVGDSVCSRQSIAAIWVTNSEKSRKSAYDAMASAGLCVGEEWVWLKTTTKGAPVTPLDGIWRKPYEILVIGMKSVASTERNADSVTRRVIAAVPDIHSRKPNLRELFEKRFFTSTSSLENGATNADMRYSALEVFARNLTAGWWACGDEVLKFNAKEWWVDR
ncbi:MT-A70 family [Aspergillus sclerotialis]|uniref:MT-A70 family n=1 Tax=Aspergillus sclerotialis TaxID=2070753 RepID=A0A3A2ZNM6_9EURO|nr:MT-A70 family [Aspergillus sclerotialis]